MRRQVNIETWRVVLADDTVREARATEYEPGDAEAWVPDYRSYHEGAATMRQAVAKVAVANEWPIAEVLAPGERSRAEVLAMVREYFGAECALDAEERRAGYSPSITKRYVDAEAALLALVGGAL